jgi:hypothetical protein
MSQWACVVCQSLARHCVLSWCDRCKKQLKIDAASVH